MKASYRIAIQTVVLVTMIGHSAAAASVSPTAWLQSIDNQLKPLVKNTRQNNGKIIQILDQMMNFNSLCRASLGNHWNTRTPEQQQEFTTTLRALIEKNVIKRLGDTTGKNPDAVTYVSEKITGEKATVTTIVRDGKGPRAAEFEIVYKLEKKGNAWTVVDMETDGVSLVANYRSQFNSIITKDGWDKLMKKMKDKLDD
jgi:phospholipid transport system substrate-binding protein